MTTRTQPSPGALRAAKRIAGLRIKSHEVGARIIDECTGAKALLEACQAVIAWADEHGHKLPAVEMCRTAIAAATKAE